MGKPYGKPMVWGSHILGNLRGLHVFLVSELAKEVAKTHGFLRAWSIDG